MEDSSESDVGEAARLELYWIPLGAGAQVVRLSGRLYEAAAARVQQRPRRRLYHSALLAATAAGATVVEMAPVPNARGAVERGVVAEGPVGARLLGRARIFRYEVRRWPGGLIPDLAFAVASPVTITTDPGEVEALLDVLPLVPTPVWGRDEIGAGEMWNSNSVTSWALATVGLVSAAGRPPDEGRAPGWDAGLAAARTGA
ncbi:MAG: hypothetical protein ACKVWR_19560 [Acidimicrobiales bacterium]